MDTPELFELPVGVAVFVSAAPHAARVKATKIVIVNISIFFTEFPAFHNFKRPADCYAAIIHMRGRMRKMYKNAALLGGISIILY